MKKTFYYFSLISLCFLAINCQKDTDIEEDTNAICSSQEHIRINSVNDIENLAAQYSQCDTIFGNLTIDPMGGEIKDFSFFHTFKVIHGNVTFRNLKGISELNILPKVTLIKGDILIENNSSITTIDTEFNSLQTLIGSIDITDNDKLKSIKGFTALQSISKSVNLKLNASLIAIEGFANLNQVGGELEINSNEKLTAISGFNSLHTISQRLHITNNINLTTIPGFDNLVSVGNSKQMGLWLFNNSIDFSNNAFKNLTSIDGSLGVFLNNSTSILNSFNKLNHVEGIELSNNTNVEIAGFEGLINTQHYVNIIGEKTGVALTGFKNLVSAAALNIYQTKNLENITGFNSLTTINGTFGFYKNGKIPNFDFLENVTAIMGRVHIYENDSLSTVSGMDRVTTIDGEIKIYDNGNLEELASFNMLVSFDHDILIEDNENLKHITGFNNIASVKELKLRHPNLLTVSGFQKLEVLDMLKIENDSVHSYAGFQNLIRVNSDVYISKNDALTDLSGFKNLESVGGKLTIQLCKVLENLNGLEKLTYAINTILIKENPKLTTIDGLKNLSKINNSIQISNNINLTNCAISSICALIDANGTLNISSNGTDCNTILEVKDKCI